MVDLRICEPETASNQIPLFIWDRNYADPASVTSIYSNKYIDETQDLMVTANLPSDNPTYQINFRTISTNEEHPIAHGSRLELTCRVPYDGDQEGHKAVFTVLGGSLAFYSEVSLGDDKIDNYWSLHVWNWHEGGQPDDTYVLNDGYTLVDIRFLTAEKLLALTSHCCIELYDVENLSTAPQIQARFVLPVTLQILSLEYPSVFHSTSSCEDLTAPDERWIWTTVPVDRVICLRMSYPRPILVISARLLLVDIPPAWFDATSEDGFAVPWSSWGPQNSRYFLRESPRFGVAGSRVIRQVLHGSSLRMHMTDFNPSAVDVTTYLPYVEMVNNDPDFDFFHRIILDEEKILMFTRTDTTERAMDVDIIDM